MDLRRAIGACLPIFIIAVVFDITGIVLLFLGIFANLRIDGRFYGDFLIYTGSLVLFFSLGLWLLWYLGNVPSPYDHAGARKGSSIAELARKISRRLSEKLKSEVMGKGAAAADDEYDNDSASQAGTQRHKSGRVTWGKSTAYVNNGYEQDAGESVDGTEGSEDLKSHRYNDTAVDENEGEDVKKQHSDGSGEEDEDALKPEELTVARVASDTQETSFQL